MIGDFEMTGRLAIALFLGAIIGFERETTNPSAGIRTHALVATGAALFTMAGAYGFADIQKSSNVDPARVAAQIAAGIGFIGAGAIIRQGSSVRGVTTAATLWLSGAIGLAVGAGAIEASIATCVLVIGALVSLRALKTRARKLGYEEWRVSIEYERGHGTLGTVLRLLQESKQEVVGIDIDDDAVEVTLPGVRSVELNVRTRGRANLLTAIEALAALPEIMHVKLGSQVAD